MSVTVPSSRNGPYVPNGVTTTFAYSFKIASIEHLAVYRLVNNAYVRVPTGDYSVTTEADGEGGNVIFGTAPASGSGNLFIVSDPPFTQTAQFTADGAFNPSSLNDPLDESAIRDLALKGMIERTAMVPVGEDGGTLPVKGERAGKFLSWDANGLPIASSGSGADSALRSDLALPSGSALIGTAQNRTIADVLASSAMRQVRGLRSFAIDRMTAFQYAHDLSNPANGRVKGFAAFAGVKGGFDKNNVPADAAVTANGVQTVFPFSYAGLVFDWQVDVYQAGLPIHTGFTVDLVAKTVTFATAPANGTSVQIKTHTVVFITNNSDSADTPGSMRWAASQLHQTGGGYAIVHPRGKIDVGQLLHVSLPSNTTWAVPGRNAILRTSLATGSVRFYNALGDLTYGHDIIFDGFHVLVEGGSETTDYDKKPGEIDAAAIIPERSNKIAMLNCTISGATDGAFDVAGGAIPATARYYTIQNCAFRNTDKCMAVGDGAGGGTTADARKVYLSVFRSVFDGCSQRHPLTSSRAFIHSYGNVISPVPHMRDMTDGDVRGSCSVGDVRLGGMLRFENNICDIGTTLAGLAGVVPAGIADTDGTGAALLSGNYFDPVFTTGTSNIRSANVAALPAGYTYPEAVDLSNVAAARADIIGKAGAGRSNFAGGNFAAVSAAEMDSTTLPGSPYPMSAFANGEQIKYDHALGLFFVRMDETAEMIGAVGADALSIERGSTLAISGGAITLLDDRVAAVSGAAAGVGTSTVLSTITPSADIPKGLLWLRCSGASDPIKVTNAGNIATQHPILLTDPTQWLVLLWSPNTAVWHVVSEPGISGAYTPTLTATLNCTITTQDAAWYEYHNGIVRLSGVSTVSVTAVGQTRFEATLPPALVRSFANGNEANGTCGSTRGNGFCWSKATTGNITVDFQATASGSVQVRWTAEYRLV